MCEDTKRDKSFSLQVPPIEACLMPNVSIIFAPLRAVFWIEIYRTVARLSWQTSSLCFLYFFFSAELIKLIFHLERIESWRFDCQQFCKAPAKDTLSARTWRQLFNPLTLIINLTLSTKLITSIFFLPSRYSTGVSSDFNSLFCSVQWRHKERLVHRRLVPLHSLCLDGLELYRIYTFKSLT